MKHAQLSYNSRKLVHALRCLYNDNKKSYAKVNSAKMYITILLMNSVAIKNN
jgi:hypothetical protein